MDVFQQEQRQERKFSEEDVQPQALLYFPGGTNASLLTDETIADSGSAHFFSLFNACERMAERIMSVLVSTVGSLN